MLGCCQNGTCATCKKERRLAGVAVMALVAFTFADNSDGDLKLPSRLEAAMTSVAAGVPAPQKIGIRLGGAASEQKSMAAPAPVAIGSATTAPAAPALRASRVD